MDETNIFGNPGQDVTKQIAKSGKSVARVSPHESYQEELDERTGA